MKNFRFAYFLLVLSLAVAMAVPRQAMSPEDSPASITVHAAGRGHPWINLRDGRHLPTAYTGAAGLQQVLQQDLAWPRALAAGDFDEDGVPDLVSGYVGPGGGILALHRGNVDSIWPQHSRPQTSDLRLQTSDFSRQLPTIAVFA